MTGSSNRLSAARRWRSLLRRPTPRTTSETHAWLSAFEQQALALSPVRMPRRPDSRDEFELALGEAMLALQLGNCDLVRLRGTSDGGVHHSGVKATLWSARSSCASDLRFMGRH